MKKRIKKFLLILIVAGEIIFLNVSPVLAVHIPSASEIANDLENRYHLNTESIQSMGEGFNVSDTKSTAPQVMLFFNPADPKPGEKLTAEALPMYFSNPKESLYYTWYLKRKDCKKDEDGRLSASQKECDRDGNNKVDKNDWKIEAMQIIANGGFDTKKAEYNSSYDNQDRDSDGYQALWGGDDRDPRLNDFCDSRNDTGCSNLNLDEYEIKPDSGNNSNNDDHAYCYIHDFRSGIDYELNTADDTDFDCPSGTARCVQNSDLVCPVEIEDPAVPEEAFNEYKVCKDLGNTPSCALVDGENVAVCDIGYPVCAPSLVLYDCDSDPKESCSTKFGSELDNPPGCTGINPGPGTNLCRHLFPSYNNFDGFIDNYQITNELDDEVVGDGDFKEEEEVFWRTNPRDPDTADNGNMDEANAVGLGISSFTWNYMEGDKVGVIVEGTSMTPSKHEGASMMIMWALPKNDCQPKNKGSYYKNIKGYNVKILTADMDLNECLEDNLVNPREGGQPTKMNVSLTYSPENPINDPTDDEMGDTIVADATIDNADQEASQIRYKWKVEISDSINFLSRDTLCDEDGCIFSDVTNTVGINIPSFSFKLGLNEDNMGSVTYNNYFGDETAYLRVSVEASENFPGGDTPQTKTREGRSDVIIKVMSTDKKIKAYRPDLDSNNLLLIKTTSPEICKGDFDNTVCSVTANEIIGVKIDADGLNNFSWTLNGEPLACSSAVSSSCGNAEQTNVNFFPVTGEKGKTYTLTLTANDITTGKTINLVKTFRVIDPYVKIISTDKNLVWPRHLGSYTDLDGVCQSDPAKCEDYSESIFETFEGNDINLQAEFHPGYIKDIISDNPQYSWEWLVDGVAQDTPTPEFLPTFAADKTAGEVYNISLNAAYNQSTGIRKALQDIWGISQFDSTEGYLSDSIQIEVFANDNVALDKPGKFLAGLLSHLPSQITFLFRILLTIFIILLTTGIVFSFIPETYVPRKPFYGKD